MGQLQNSFSLENNLALELLREDSRAKQCNIAGPFGWFIITQAVINVNQSCMPWPDMRSCGIWERRIYGMGCGVFSLIISRLRI